MPCCSDAAVKLPKNYTTADFDPSAGIFNLINAGGSDIFVSKLDSNGNFVWAKNLGGTDYEDGYGIAVDSIDNVYTTGHFGYPGGTADFDPGAGTFNLTSAGNFDIFVSKLDSNGNFVWAKRMGGVDFEAGRGVAIDTSGNIYTTGHFHGTVDFDPNASIFNLTSAGDNDIFVSKLNSNGNFVWAKNMEGMSNDIGTSIATDSSNNVYTTGSFEGTLDFDPGAGTSNLSSVGNPDIFVSKLDSNGNFVWAKSMGGASYDVGSSIIVDSSDNIYTTGQFENTADFDPNMGTFNLTSAGNFDIFISKLGNDIVPTPTTTPSGTNTVSSLPKTGFAPNKITALPAQPTNLAHSNLGSIWLEIPSQNIQSKIVGVPKIRNSWDVKWLNNDTGWLNDTAFPTWKGNSVLTGHVTNASGLPGPFNNIKNLKYGDQIIVHLFDEQYIFEVRNTRLGSPYFTSFAFEHLEDYP